MALIEERDRQEIRKILDDMQQPVKLTHFTQTLECDTCDETRAVLTELAELSHKLSLEVFNFAVDKEKVAQYGIDKVPATAIEGCHDYGLRFYGAPAGYEFASLLDTILLASQRDSGLSPASRSELASVTEPIHLEVLVTPT